MTGNRDKVPAIKALLEKGQYRIDPHATAEALMRRLGMWPFEFEATRESSMREAAPAVEAGRQNECSYPERFRMLPRNPTPAGPSITEPIRVRPVFAAGEV
jgi:hypothetical protein